MRKLFIGIGVFLGLLAVIVAILPSLLSAERYKDTIESRLGASLGREVTINGPVSITAFPVLKAQAHDITIHNPVGFALATNSENTQAFITMPVLDAHIRILPLLSKRIEISRFALQQPKISLLQNSMGQNNWTFGETLPETTQDTRQKKQPFLRDGRYGDLALSLGDINISDGDILIKNEQSDTVRQLRHVNLKASMDGLTQPVHSSGSLDYNGTKFTYQSSLNTPRLFLDGAVTPFMISLKSDIQSLSIDGQFKASQQPFFTAKLKVDIPSVRALDKVLGVENPYRDLTEIFNFAGDVNWSGTEISLSNATTHLQSKVQNTSFNGDVALDLTGKNTPILNGSLKFSSENINAFIKTLNLSPQQLSTLPEMITLVDTVSFDSSFQNEGTNLLAKNLTLSVGGKALQASYVGSMDFNASRANALILDGVINANSDSIPTVLSALKMDQNPAFTPLLQAGNLVFKSKVRLQNKTVLLDDLTLNSVGSNMTLGVQGQAQIGDTVLTNASFTFSAPSVAALTKNLASPSPYLQSLGAVTAQGKISLTDQNILSIDEFATNLTNGLLNGDFTGSISMPIGENQTGAVQYQGKFNTSTKSMRQLAKIGGTILAASTQQGDIYGPMSMSGKISGDKNHLSIQETTLSLDDIQAKGDLGVNLKGLRPQLNGNLSLNGLDLRPYLIAQNPTGEIKPWSDDPLDFKALTLFDADLMLTTPTLIAGRIQMENSKISTNISNGILKARLADAVLYGGVGDLDFTLDGRSSTPEIMMNFTLKNMDGKGFLGAAAGFTQLSGNTGTSFTLKGAGNTQNQIMSSLSGNGLFELAKGLISGIDLTQLTENFSTLNPQTLLQTRALPTGVGPQYSTNFEKLAGKFTIENGVVRVGDFVFNAGPIRADASGSLDLGKQMIDFSFRPYRDGASGLAGFGLPIRFSGGFGTASASLDTAQLQKVVAALAKEKLQKTITNQVGKSLGIKGLGSLGGLGGLTKGIGGSGSNSTGNNIGKILTGNTGSGGKTITTNTIGSVLGILKSPSSSSEKPESKTESETESKTEAKKQDTAKSKKKEEVLEGVLKGIFGGG